MHVTLSASCPVADSASSKNFENLLVTDDSFLLQKYHGEFERLWGLFWGGTFGGDAANSHLLAVVKLQAIQRGKACRRASQVRGRPASAPPHNLGEFPELLGGGRAAFSLPASLAGE